MKPTSWEANCHGNSSSNQQSNCVGMDLGVGRGLAIGISHQEEVVKTNKNLRYWRVVPMQYPSRHTPLILYEVESSSIQDWLCAQYVFFLPIRMNNLIDSCQILPDGHATLAQRPSKVNQAGKLWIDVVQMSCVHIHEQSVPYIFNHMSNSNWFWDIFCARRHAIYN